MDEMHREGEVDVAGPPRARSKFRVGLLVSAGIILLIAVFVCRWALPGAMQGWARQRLVGTEAFRRSIDLSRPGKTEIVFAAPDEGMGVQPFLEVSPPLTCELWDNRAKELHGLKGRMEFYIGSQLQTKAEVDSGLCMDRRNEWPIWYGCLGWYEPGAYRVILCVDQPAAGVAGRKQEIVGRVAYYGRTGEGDRLNIYIMTWHGFPLIGAGLLLLVAGLPGVIPRFPMGTVLTWALIVPGIGLAAPTIIWILFILFTFFRQASG